MTRRRPLATEPSDYGMLIRLFVLMALSFLLGVLVGAGVATVVYGVRPVA